MLVSCLDAVTDAYVDLRTWTVRTGHGLDAKDHEAERASRADLVSKLMRYIASYNETAKPFAWT